MICWRNTLAALGAALAIGGCSGASAQAQAPSTAAIPSSVDSAESARAPQSKVPAAPDLAGIRQEAPPFIEVSGRGQVTVPPDRARVHFTVETEAKSAAEAASTNAELMTAVLAAVRGAGAAGFRVETFGYNLQPVYARQDGNRVAEISGYRAFNNVRVTTSDTEAVGTLIDAALGGGANRIAGLAFDAEDTEEAQREALRLAVASARSQAETIAAAMGVPLGPALEVRGGSDTPVFRANAGVAYRMAEAVPTPVEASDATVSANVTIKYGLGGER